MHSTYRTKGKHIAESSKEPSRDKQSSDSRFPSEYHHHAFKTHSFQLIPARSLDGSFFHTHVPEVIQIISHYKLEKLVYCVSDTNIDLVTEFYNNLQSTGDTLVYKTRVQKQDISFTPDILGSFLECRPSSSTLECFPFITEPLESFNLDSIHQYFFKRARQPGVNLASAMELSAPDNVLYKVIVGCILPIVTRGQAKVRPHHLLALHIFKNRLDFNVALNIFLCIVHFSIPVQKKIYMPFGHILTSWLASLGINTSRGNIKKLSEKFDIIKWRNFSLAGMTKVFRGVEWADGHQAGEYAEEEAEEGEEAEELADEPYSTVSEQLSRIRANYDAFSEDVDTRFEEIQMENERRFQSLDTRLGAMHLENEQQFSKIYNQQTEILEMLKSIRDNQYSSPSQED